LIDLDLWLEPGTVTRDQNGEQTTIDLFFGTPDLTERLVVCELALDCHADSDHLPIRVLLDVNSEPIIQENTYLCANLIFEIAPQRRGLELPF
jgi:hypothetical protein